MSEPVFAVETWRDEREFAIKLNECMAAYAAAWDRGYRGQAHVPFEPHLESLIGAVVARQRQFVTARKDGKIVALQHWTFNRDLESLSRLLATMTLIYKSTPDACDTTAFLRFGAQAMKDQGATSVAMLAWSGVPSLRARMEAIGAKLGDYLMEIP
jgi:hypothetical protein